MNKRLHIIECKGLDVVAIIIDVKEIKYESTYMCFLHKKIIGQSTKKISIEYEHLFNAINA